MSRIRSSAGQLLGPTERCPECGIPWAAEFYPLAALELSTCAACARLGRTARGDAKAPLALRVVRGESRPASVAVNPLLVGEVLS